MNDMNVGCFMSLAATCDLTVTAGLFNISKTSVMQNIKRLEEDLGTELFLAIVPEVRLSEAGRKYKTFFQIFEAKLENATNELSHVKKEEDLSIAWTDYISCPDWIKRAIVLFQEQNRDISILTYQVPPDHLLRMLSDRTADIIISSHYFTRGMQGAVKTSVLGEIPLCLIMAKDSLYVDMSMLEIFKFDVPFFASYAYEKNEEDVINRVAYDLMTMGCRRRRVSVLPNLDNVYISVRLGNGVTICPFNDKLRMTDAFEYLELPRTATICMTRLQSNASVRVTRFESFLETFQAEMGEEVIV